MSLDIEARLREFLASAPQTIYMIEVISIAHSDLTQTYHLWREPSNGGVVDENDNVLTVRSTNFTVALAGTPDNLDQKFTVNIDTTDPDNLLRKELDRIPLDTTEKILQILTQERELNKKDGYGGDEDTWQKKEYEITLRKLMHEKRKKDFQK